MSLSTRTSPIDREVVLAAIVEAVLGAVHEVPVTGKSSFFGPLHVGVSTNTNDDWYGTTAKRAARRHGNPTATIHVNREHAVSVIASPSGNRVLVVVPKGTDVEVYEDTDR